MSRRLLIPAFAVLASLIYLPYLYGMGSRPPRKPVPLRVLVIKSASEINLRIRGAYSIVDLDNEGVLKQGRSLRGFSVSAKDIDSKGIKVLPEKRARVYIGNRQFRGDIDIIKTGNARVQAVNHIDLEDYLYGVLYHEVSHRWPIEVLKAQAIAARTYALYQKLISKDEHFDLAADIYSQVYGGRTSETWRTTRAVNLTQGQVLTYNGKLFPTYYHATCGGHTSDASSIWNIDIPVLEGKACDYCRISPHYKWKKELTMEYLQARLRDAGYKIQAASVGVLERDEAGRALNLIVRGNDRDVELTGNRFRLLMGPNLIRSTNFNVETKGKYVRFQGKGWGHGIGMCQWGAYGMSRRGWKAEKILEYYYPGAALIRLE